MFVEKAANQRLYDLDIGFHEGFAAVGSALVVSQPVTKLRWLLIQRDHVELHGRNAEFGVVLGAIPANT